MFISPSLCERAIVSLVAVSAPGQGAIDLCYEGFVSVKTEGRSTCQACGAQVPVGVEFCPVCALRGALDVGNETAELHVAPTPSLPALRFDHYEILTRVGGTPLEIGRAAMWVRYKALDVNLRSTVALKVINARLIGDEPVRPALCPRSAFCGQRAPSEYCLGIFTLSKAATATSMQWSLWKGRRLGILSNADDLSQKSLWK